MLLLLNAHDDSRRLHAARDEGERWDALLDTGHDGFEGRRYGGEATYPLRRALARAARQTQHIRPSSNGCVSSSWRG